jgi:hypothetical protein
MPVRDLLHEAMSAARHGLYLAAGCFARAALETRLRELADYHGVRPKRRSKATLEEFAGVLFMHRHIDKQDHSEIKRLAKVGNLAAHNRGVGWFEVECMIAGVREFVDRHGVDCETLEAWRQLMGEEGGAA